MTPDNKVNLQKEMKGIRNSHRKYVGKYRRYVCICILFFLHIFKSHKAVENYSYNTVMLNLDLIYVWEIQQYQTKDGGKETTLERI